MMKNHTNFSVKLRDQGGMTLLEIMLALLILGTVMTMVSISLSGSLDVLNATRDQGDIYHRAQVALQRISEDLTSAVLVDKVEFVGGDEQLDGGDADSLQFTSTAHVVFNHKVDNQGVAVITYSVQEDPEREGELVLYRSDQLLVTNDPREGIDNKKNGFILCDRLRSVNFIYFDVNGDEVDAWTTDADMLSEKSDRRLPVAVSCTLEFWIDRDQETSIEFSTSALLPVGLINAQNDQS